MRKKLMLLAAGALSALAFAAVPSVASADELMAHCSSAPCVGAIQGTGASTFVDDGGLAIQCTTVAGTTSMTATSTTMTATLEFSQCEDDIFGTECNNQGAGTGRINTNVLTGHLINLATTPAVKAGVLLTGANVTFKCPVVGVQKTVTGNIIGTIEDPKCKQKATNHTVVFEREGFVQKHKTYTGNPFNLTSGTHPNPDTTPSAQTGTAHLNYGGGKTVEITC